MYKRIERNKKWDGHQRTYLIAHVLLISLLNGELSGEQYIDAAPFGFQSSFLLSNISTYRPYTLFTLYVQPLWKEHGSVLHHNASLVLAPRYYYLCLQIVGCFPFDDTNRYKSTASFYSCWHLENDKDRTTFVLTCVIKWKMESSLCLHDSIYAKVITSILWTSSNHSYSSEEWNNCDWSVS